MKNSVDSGPPWAGIDGSVRAASVPGPTRIRVDEAARARMVAAVVLVLLALPIVFSVGIRSWPFTSWELFSGVRSETGSTWRVFAVDADGEEAPIDLASAGDGMNGWFQLAKQFDHMPADEQAAVCTAWLKAAQEIREPVQSLNLYRFRTEFVVTDGEVRRDKTEPVLIAECLP